MAEPFIGEIRTFGFGFAPKYWALCQGQLLPISQNQPLFALLGVRYGGDGRVSFALPDLRGRTPLGAGGTTAVGAVGGRESITFTQAQMPSHTHQMQATAAAALTNAPGGNLLAGNSLYGAVTTLSAMNSGTIGASGGSQPAPLMQPSLVLNFCIALQGIFPSRG